jgi:broad specificity phosphatase PhoE
MELKVIAIVTALVAGSILALSATGSAQEAIFVVRHSDPPPMLRVDEILDETPLSESGQERAKVLAARLKDAGISAIYATEAKRTVQTAEPLAQALGIQIEVHLGDDTDGLIKDLRSEHPEERVRALEHHSAHPEGLGRPAGGHDRAQRV